MLLPVDFLAFPEQDGNQAASGESRSDASHRSAQSSIMDNEEDTQARTMNWLRVEAESESVPGGVGLDDALMVDVMEGDQLDESPDSVPDDSERVHITHAHTDSPSDPVHGTAHVSVDVLVALGDPLTPGEVELEEVAHIHTPHETLQFSQDLGGALGLQIALFVRWQAKDLWGILNL